jgi:hypothetical protein
MSSVVIALLPILGLNKEKIRGNQEAVLPHNQEAVLPHNQEAERGFIGKLPHNSGNWPDDQSAGVLLRSHIIRENSHSSGVFHKFQGSLT